MRLIRLAITLIMLFSVLAIHADEASEIRASLSKLKGRSLLAAYDRLCVLSRDSDDFHYQLACLNDLIAEAERQQDWVKSSEARVKKMIAFYNAELDDSLYEQIRPTLEFLREMQSWKDFDEVQ